MPYTKVYISIIAWLDRLTQVSVMNLFSVFICHLVVFQRTSVPISAISNIEAWNCKCYQI